MARLAVLGGLSLLMCLQIVSSTKLVCYFTNWSQYRPGVGRYMPSNVDPNLCTHLIYAFSAISPSNELSPYEWNDDILYKSFNALKQTNPKLKTLLAVGGWNFGIAHVHWIDEQKVPYATKGNEWVGFDNWQSFEIKAQYLKDNKFGGAFIWALDLDDFSGQFCGQGNYPLIGKLSSLLDLDYPRPPPSITTTAKTTTTTVASGDDFCSGKPDGIYKNDMDSNSFYQCVYGHTYHQRCQELLEGYTAEGTATDRPRLMISAAVAAGKGTIDAGYEIAEIAKYLDFINVMTYDYHGTFEDVTGHHSPLYKGSQDTGNHAYLNTICTFLQGASVHLIEDQEVPYAIKQNEWVGYDNKESFQTKADYLKDNRFGGAFVWSLDLDDFKGQFCGQGNYPLISFLRSLLGPDLPPLPTRETTITTSAKPPDNFCATMTSGVHAKPDDPHSFYNCANGITWILNCPANLIFKDSCHCCDWPLL
ncbi:Acidic mammalian chitinase [Larimichthys crocea]|uniref:Uncharacterized protein n=1 Tax=Larimichthys crocea TaxID=215358 RepID=A0ACD3RAG5_LARCR|nr:Acidic mammalian chitinase [Larimichthys crocea]